MPDGSPEAARRLGEKLRELRERTGLTQRAYAQKHTYNPSTLNRYELGGHLPRKVYVDTLLREVARRGKPPLTPQDQQDTYDWYRKALGPRNGRNGSLAELFELEVRIDDLNAQVTGLYMQAADLQARNEHLQTRLAAGEPVRPEDEEQLRREGAELIRRRAELEAEQATVQRRIDELEQRLPLDDEQAAIAPPPTVPPGEHPSHQRNRARITQWVLATALAAALALLGIIALRPQTPSATAQGHHTQPAPTTSASSATSSATSSAATAAQSSASAGQWTMHYHDTSITMPPVEGIACQLASMDFDPPRGYEGSGDALSGALDDLTVQTACGDPANITSNAKTWGTSSSQEPGPGACLNDANQHGLPHTLPLSKITIGSAYCLITSQGSLAWFKVTAKPGSQQQGLTVLATMWTQPDGT
ncbi:helix-turn-helix domain-containing protein [Streptomyces broussonetiae]|uniref:Helix-turn-helix domain-containing protein n=1 Tax=Streptomyces broussonetiae TaxID=2686304 RepID=A0A6I6MVH8_9ACTN|nr:helix-turn-helix domain-containing protein [Streptomyces broussonetiae]QHA02259.1 helix-turn-helix domain-containing protein [Streptomyces broussonetiae]